MANMVPKFITSFLKEKNKKGLDRKLRIYPEGIDFFSNDYLGFARSVKLQKIFNDELQKKKSHFLGSTGSRLISGNSLYVERLEEKIAKFHAGKVGLMFNSGYNANLGVLSSIGSRDSITLYDELCHASIRDGIRLGLSKSYSFKHNDIHDLEKKIRMHRNSNDKIKTFIAIEALYSMDGDMPPLKEIVGLCKKYNAHIILDESHSTGTVGKRGQGLAVKEGLEKEILVRVHTFGKAMGCFGAIVICDPVLKEYLVNKARSFIYTTALPYFNLLTIECSYQYIEKNHSKISKLNKNIQFFKESIPQDIRKYFLPSGSPIQACIIPGNAEIKKTENVLWQNGFHVKAILEPTVPKGKERMRFSIHSFNTKEEIKNLLDIIHASL